MTLSRRSFLRNAAATSAAFSSLPLLTGCARSSEGAGYINQVEGYGALQSDPRGLFDLPEGFSYVTMSETGDPMDDGLLVPGDHDGMAAFPGADASEIVLIRNHELSAGQGDKSPFGPNQERIGRIDRSRLYDWTAAGEPHLGGTTNVVLDARSLEIKRQFLSLGGTVRNCAGGPTPWGSWITCEETLMQVGDGARRDHGWAFEVPASADGLIEPVALHGLGRFNREAAAIDPATGVVYATEDDFPGLLYRFLPDHPGELHRGGRLQALAIRGVPGADTTNWDERLMSAGDSMAVEWIDLEAIHNPDNDLAARAVAAGAANFTRGEGCWFGQGELFFCATNGGPERIGQIWRYRPSRFEGYAQETEEPGTLELFVETNDERVLEKCDNITVAPWGDLIVVEDGDAEQFIRGVTPEGRLYTIGRNAARESDGEYSEITGPCFSPDGATLFFNVQRGPGRTFAVRGPWAQRSLSAV
jgi:hypothetical protein